MALKVTVDEDLPRQAVQLLREHGYDAASVVDQAWVDGKMHSYGLLFKEMKGISSLRTKGLVTFAVTYPVNITEFYFCDRMRMEFVPSWIYSKKS